MLPSFAVLRRLWVVRIVWPLLATVVCTVLIASESISILSAVRSDVLARFRNFELRGAHLRRAA